ncbi:MAG: hypothetical protein RJA44_650 [Pseudomonadota bacterium]|jgi:hypothetical protein
MPIQFEEITAEIRDEPPTPVNAPPEASTRPAALDEERLREALRLLSQRQARLSDA